jgi:hypothetical protein
MLKECTKFARTRFNRAGPGKLMNRLDYRFVVNPAYNADRGPVSILSGRPYRVLTRGGS